MGSWRLHPLGWIGEDLRVNSWRRTSATRKSQSTDHIEFPQIICDQQSSFGQWESSVSPRRWSGTTFLLSREALNIYSYNPKTKSIYISVEISNRAVEQTSMAYHSPSVAMSVGKSFNYLNSIFITTGRSKYFPRSPCFALVDQRHCSSSLALIIPVNIWLLLVNMALYIYRYLLESGNSSATLDKYTNTFSCCASTTCLCLGTGYSCGRRFALVARIHCLWVYIGQWESRWSKHRQRIPAVHWLNIRLYTFSKFLSVK